MNIETLQNGLAKREQGYRPNGHVQAELQAKRLVLLVSPFAVGKSTLMNRIVELDNLFGRISGLTTRPARPEDEPGMYRYLPHTAASLDILLGKVIAGELVQYAIHPTTGNVYATELQDYPNAYNMKDVLGHAIAGFRALPTGGSHTFGIVCQPDEWGSRIRSRYPNTEDPEAQKRMKEAALNLQWSLQDSSTIWVENATNQLDSAVHTIITHTCTEQQPDSTEQARLRTYANAMLEFATKEK